VGWSGAAHRHRWSNFVRQSAAYGNSYQAQATLLLDLVERWNSDKMHEGRVALDEVEAKAKECIYSKNLGWSEKQIANELKEHFRVIMPEIETILLAFSGAALAPASQAACAARSSLGFHQTLIHLRCSQPCGRLQ